MYPTMPEVGVQLSQKMFRSRNDYFLFHLNNRGSALDCHALNFAPGQIEPTTARYARMDQIQMGPHPPAKQADHFVPSGGWRPPPNRYHWPGLVRKDAIGLM